MNASAFCLLICLWARVASAAGTPPKKQSSNNRATNMKTLNIFGAVVALALVQSAYAAPYFLWNGNTSSDPTVAANWSHQPTIGGVNNGLGAFCAANGKPMNWNEPSTTTIISGSGSQLLIGDTPNQAGGAGIMNMQAGTLIFTNMQYSALVGQNNGLTNVINMSGGVIYINGVGGNGLSVGNTSTYANTWGIINISGGIFTVNAVQNLGLS
jgi:hypothetical protein